MKKNFLFFILSLSICFSSCKKGEDDPSFSLRTRKARIKGDWHLISGNLKLSYTKPNVTYGDNIYTLSKNSYTLVTTGNGGVFTGGYSLDLTFDKKGEFNFKQAIDTLKLNATGIWDFMDGTVDEKKKERIVCNISSINKGSGWIDAFNKSNYNFSYKIRELRKEKLVLETEEELVASSSKDSSSVYVTSKYVFER